MWWIIIVVLVVALAAGYLWYFLFRASHPQHQGTLHLPGLKGPVEVVRDRWGLPHIYAQSVDDAYFAQGFVHAQDRFWQMEINRRVGMGRLAERFGPVALDADRFLRRLGLRRAAEKEWAEMDDADSRRGLEAYAAGVNAYLAQGKLPVELRILGYKPEPWTPVDSLTWIKMMALSLSSFFEAQLVRAWLVDQVGPEWAARLEPLYPQRHPVIVPPGAVNKSGRAPDLSETPRITAATAVEVQRLYEAAKAHLPLGSWGAASNNWVVSGERSKSGKPLLANDPHLPMSQPSIWYEVHLTAPDLDVIGGSFAGTPGVVLGHNQRIAWAVTNSQISVQDVYVERFHPEKPGLYEYKGEWLQAEKVEEVIRVKGRKEPVVETIWVTRHGPVINGGLSGLPADAPALALRWTAHDPGNSLKAFARLNQASNWEEFLAALNHLVVPGQNFLYADVDGNIGYTCTGKVPIRANGQGLVPMAGWDGEHEWTGYIPWDEMPRLYNPESGYIVTANNKVTLDSYDYCLGHEFMTGYRAARILDIIQEVAKFDPDLFATMQTDVWSLPGLELQSHYRVLQGDSPALKLLQQWDGNVSIDSAGASVSNTVLVHLSRLVAGAVLKDAKGGAAGPGGAVNRWLSEGYNPLGFSHVLQGRFTPVLLRLLDERPVDWPLPAAPDGMDRWEHALHTALAAAEAELRQRLGPDPQQWTWGRLHQASLPHALGAVKLLRPIFNVGPFPVGGDNDTVFQAAITTHKPYGAESWLPSWRHISDLADLTRSLSTYQGGQVAHPGHKHYADLLPLWRQGRLKPLYFAPEDVRANAEARLHLQPATAGAPAAPASSAT